MGGIADGYNDCDEEPNEGNHSKCEPFGRDIVPQPQANKGVDTDCLKERMIKKPL